MLACHPVAKVGIEPVEGSEKGVDDAVLPAAEDVIGLGADPPICLPVGHFAGACRAVAPYPAAPGTGDASYSALGGQAAGHFRHRMPGEYSR